MSLSDDAHVHFGQSRKERPPFQSERKMKSKRRSAGGVQPAQAVNIPEKFKSKNSDVQGVIERLKTELPIEEQQKLIKGLVERLSDDEDESEFIVLLLTHLFLTGDPKHPIRKTLQRVLANVSRNAVVSALAVNVKCLIEDCGERELFGRDEIIRSLHGCFNNFPPGVDAISCVFDRVASFTVEFFADVVQLLGWIAEDNASEDDSICKSDLHSYIYNITKLLVSILQQCVITSSLSEYSAKLTLSSYEVILDEQLPFDVKSNCGLIMVISLVHLPDRDHKRKTNPCLSLLTAGDDRDRSINFEGIAGNDTAMLCVYSGILNVVPHNILCEETVDGIPVITFMLGKLLESAERNSGKPTQILEVSRALVSASRVTNDIPLSYTEPLFDRTLEYVWAHLDHFVDAVKYSAQTIFENLIKLAHRNREGRPILLKTILANLMAKRCGNYVALTVVSSVTGCSFLLEEFPRLPFVLLADVADSSSAPQVCSTYEHLMLQHATEEANAADEWLERWVDSIKPLLMGSGPPATGFYQRLLVSAYKIQPLVLKSITHYQGCGGANELGALLGCLRAARKSGLAVPTVGNIGGGVDVEGKFWRGMVEFEFLEPMMLHQVDEVRISVLALVVESQKSTEIFTAWELDFLGRHFRYNVTSQSSGARQQIIALYKKALLRIKEGLAVLLRSDSRAAEALEYRAFTEAFLREHLAAGLTPGSNYPRRATCLELLVFAVGEACVGPDVLAMVWTRSDTLNLLRMLCDTYESNVALASDLIQKMPPRLFQRFQSKETIKVNIQDSLDLASTIRPTSATSAGYILQVHLRSPHARQAMMELMRCPPVNIDHTVVVALALLSQMIQEALEVAERNILTAVRKSPCFGLLQCVRHLIEKGNLSKCNCWGFVMMKLVVLCNQISHVVSPIVNNASPEGYLPADDSDEAVTSQMVLVFAWRTVKEVSLLLGELVSNAPDVNPRTGKRFLCEELLRMVEEHFLNLFLETKHRGAYEQAYLGFCKFCSKLWGDSVYDAWPKTWLSNILKILSGENENTFHKLCPTRRSAGLPFMVQAILITEPPSTGNEHFHACVKRLLGIAGDALEDNLKSRVHAMNILRALFRHNQLGELVAQYVAQGVKIAVAGFGNDAWGIRNSATLFFAALMIRIFGVHRTKDGDELSPKNRLSARVFFMRYPELRAFLLLELIRGTKSGGRDGVALQPVLLILERLYPCGAEEENQLEEYVPYVTRALSNCNEKVRELAARASASLLPGSGVARHISKTLATLSDATISDNFCQGLLLQLTYLLKCPPKGRSHLNIPDVIGDTFWIFISAGRFVSHYTASLYFDVVVSLTTAFRKTCRGAPVFRRMLEVLMWQSIGDGGRRRRREEVLSTAKKKFRVARFNLQLHVAAALFQCDEYFKALYLKEVVLSGLRDAREEINRFCLNFLDYLHFDSKHSLYLTERLEVSDREFDLVSGLDANVKGYVIESVHKDLRAKLLPALRGLLERNSLRVFMVLRHYPCVLNSLRPHKQEVLDFLLGYARRDEDLYCAALTAISAFLSGLRDTTPLDFSALIKTLVVGASPSSALQQRVSAAQFLVAHKKLFYTPVARRFAAEELAELWNAAVSLTEDDDQLVRDAVGLLSTEETGGRRVISEKAREDLLRACAVVLPPKVSVPLLLAWALRRRGGFEEEKESVEVFDKGAANAFAEERPLAGLSLSCLEKVLWKLGEGLKYEDRSIFVEEHTLMVATNVYDIVHQNLPAVIDADARATLLRPLGKIREFLERCPIENGRRDLRTDLGRLLSKEFTGGKCGGDDARFRRIEYVLKRIFNVECDWPD